MSSSKLITSTVAVAMLAALSATSGAQEPPRQRPPERREAAVAPPRWERLVSDQGAFSVLMPGKPSFRTKVLTTNTGGLTDYREYLLDLGHVAYAVSYSTYRTDGISLDGAASGIARGAKGKLVSSREIALAGHPGKAIVVEAEGVVMRGRIYRVENVLYQVFVNTSRDHDSVSDSEYFFRSFQLYR